MRWLRRRLLDSATRALTRRRSHYHRLLPSHLGSLRTTLHKGDVLLVDGDQRVSEVIKYLTQSSWSHAAIYIGDELWRRHPERRADLEARFGVDARHLLVEALMEDGVVASPLAKYDGHNLRVCRPHGLRPDDCRHVIDEILAQLGSRYAVHNALALARYFFPVLADPAALASPRPRARRRRHRGGHLLDADRACLQARRLPDPARGHAAARSMPHAAAGAIGSRAGPYPHVFHREPCALITPRDFDLSPYFDVVKLTGLADREIDYRRIRWA